ncbi:MAG: hemin-degrading factor [Gammaproteobacteria bacterium HGW-Gammaproteobacteria-14]|nr:MAG: hemin-degrading factor [Gammaproteobacteria bacterium HGW-Gammaproteobacteria-14]
MEINQIVGPDAASLRRQWLVLRDQNPTLRIRNAAQQLGVSEMSLLLTEPEDHVLRLKDTFSDIYASLSGLGRIMTLARNDEVVHETIGTMTRFTVSAQGRMGLCLGDIDLRVFFSNWAHGYAVTDKGPKGDRHSLQFFDASGAAVHKVYAVSATDMTAWQELVNRYLAETQRPEITESMAEKPARYKGFVDHDQLRNDWQSITDVHEFHGMLKKHGLDRLTALESIGTDWAYPVATNALEVVLNRVASDSLPIMVFVGNKGIVQIYTGPVVRLVNIPGWFNVLDHDFNLHVSTGGISAVWVVKRPSEDGDITSLDGFNRDGELVFSVFGARKPGVPEMARWRDVVASLDMMS